jgi:tetratricopeptide (TPR) repeat protein
LIFGLGKKKKEENDWKGDDRSTHINGAVTNSPISSGDYYGTVNYNYVTINIPSKEIQAVLKQVKKTPDKEFQIQGSADRGTENMNDLQALKNMEAVTKLITKKVKSKEQKTGRRVEQIRTNNDLQFSRNELLIKEALIEGDKYFAIGRYNEAISSYNRILTLDPNHEVALNNKGAALAGLGQPSQAISYLDKALSINPDNPYAWENKARILRALGRIVEATECSIRARQLGLSV